ncbi:DUF4377 domain-containing protein [Bacteroides helcogenes]|uniref:DUF4377 domain-containing protein n=1 Tax=Bacteroides helcogenes (strain ATCC 35417 / DSM 20613 / JCM 6297 / CCUG 15421 / P 36-108) TaxID=693979 RepID=E6SUX0_BACT6|nr:DUF4377 domain-containing protein [Bacteroides helcogenes]ADV42406.1 hypothetical protein Bache_0378 [Bacteroides helcogenes P 36-108]MDY5238091.1 DUF4377 domain-containing protein [Bacteroides helcogenes]
MKKLLFLFLNALVLTIMGCGNDAVPKDEAWDSERTIIIASKKLFGVVPNIEHHVCDSLYAVKNASSDEEWKAFSVEIENFDYQPGYEYVLKLNIHHVRLFQDGI